jgi:predicted secreted protein
MWSYIVDDEGTQRVAIFYKAAFYDRDAFMRPV